MSNDPDRNEKRGGGDKANDDKDDDEEDDDMGGGLFSYILRSLLGTRARPKASSASSTQDVSDKVRALPSFSSCHKRSEIIVCRRNPVCRMRLHCRSECSVAAS